MIASIVTLDRILQELREIYSLRSVELFYRGSMKEDFQREWYIDPSKLQKDHFVLVHKNHIGLVCAELKFDTCSVCTEKIPENLLIQYKLLSI